MCICAYIYIYIYILNEVYTYIYIYMHTQEAQRPLVGAPKAALALVSGEAARSLAFSGEQAWLFLDR